MPEGDNRIALVALVLGLALIAVSVTVSFMDLSIPVPEKGLREWTDWAAKYVALVIAATKVWTLADKLIAKI